jgi:GNAT superfamily N-acetyltransferase
VGIVGLYRRPEGVLRVPTDNIDLAFAVTGDEVRGTGAGLALTAHALTWAHEQGFRSMTVDWRSVNLLSSRFWPRRGFRPQYLRLYRAVP